MKHSRNLWLLIALLLVLLLAGLGGLPDGSLAQTVPPPLPAVHPLYGECEQESDGTLPPPLPEFEPFLPNSIYVDWCGQAILTLAQPGASAANLRGNTPGSDPTVGHRIGLFYSNDQTETGWLIAGYSYRVDFAEAELRARKTTLLRELCPLGDICNELLVAQLGREGTTFSVLNANGEQQLQPQTSKLFVPFVSNK
jgi:hypothetical protein